MTFSEMEIEQIFFHRRFGLMRKIQTKIENMLNKESRKVNAIGLTGEFSDKFYFINDDDDEISLP